MKQMLISDCANSAEYGKLKKINYFMWDVAPLLLPKAGSIALLEKQRISRELFNIDNGITLVKKTKDYMDFYNFGSTKNNKNIRKFLLTNIDFLENFILYFLEKARNLIKSSFTHKINFSRKYFEESNENDERNSLADIKSRKIFVDICRNKYITRKEFECLKHVAHGKSYKETAKLLNTSRRTVENYLYHSKERLDLNTTSDLVNMFWINFNEFHDI